MTWSVPECPFRIEWAETAMQQIRAPAVEGLFALKHGGAEIGGVLLGTHADGVVRIMAARALACEYALGPTFTLSGKDHARLAALLDQGCDDFREQGWEPVGWYHSHTRSGIMMSDRDLDIHNRYFPNAWQVALVVRPHAIEPVRGGFFFRESGGTIRADASYREFELESAVGRVEKAVSPATSAAPVSAPAGGTACPTKVKRSLRWLWAAILLGVVLGMAAAPFTVRNAWTRVFAADRPPSVALTAYDLNGQLQIRWDQRAEAIRSAQAGTLEIVDGAAHTVVALDQRRLRAGTVSYARIGARIDVSLTLPAAGGDIYEEFTSFAGQAAPPASGARELQEQDVRLRELEKQVAGLRWLIKSGQAREDHPYR